MDQSEATNFDNARLQGGDITLRARDAIFLNQINAETNSKFEFQVGGVTIIIDAETLASSAGALTLRTPETIRLRDGATVSVSATGGAGIAGDIRFFARSLFLGDQSQISSQTDSGNGGNIFIDLKPTLGHMLLMEPGSTISTTAGRASQEGDGGNISINASLILTLPEWNSDITANAGNGNGGNINITTNGLFGITPRPELTSLSDITASSTLGLNGTITISNLGSDPVQAAAELPIDTVPLPLTQHCQTSAVNQGHFVNRERGGIALSPDDPISSDLAWEDISPPNIVTQPVVLTEADHWQIDDAGQLVLQTTQVTETSPFTCPS